MLGRVKHPRLVAVKSDREILVPGTFDRSANLLGRVIPSNDADLFAVDIQHRFDVAGLVQSVEITCPAAGSRSLAGADAADRNLDQMCDVGRMTNPNDCPLQTGFRRITSPEDLCRTLWFGFQIEARRQ